MSRHYSDPTANAALGPIEREFRRLSKKADKLKARREAGLLTPEEIAAARKEFRGIYRHLLAAALTPPPSQEDQGAPDAENPA